MAKVCMCGSVFVRHLVTCNFVQSLNSCVFFENFLMFKVEKKKSGHTRDITFLSLFELNHYYKFTFMIII